MTPHIGVTLLFLVVLAGAGCHLIPSGTTVVSTAASPPHEMPSPVGSSQLPSAPAEDPATAFARVQAAVLKVGDLPGPWVTTSPPRAGATPLTLQLYTCLGIAPEVLSQNREESVDSDTFSMNLGSIRVENSIVVGESARVASAAFQLLGRPRTPACFDAILHPQPGASATGSQLDSSATTALDFAPFPDPVNAVRTTIVLTKDGVHLSVYADTVFVLQGRVTSSFFFLSAVSPLDRRFEQRVVRTVAGRVAQLTL